MQTPFEWQDYIFWLSQIGSRKYTKVYLIIDFRKTRLGPNTALTLVRYAANYKDSHYLHLGSLLTCTKQTSASSIQWGSERNFTRVRCECISFLERLYQVTTNLVLTTTQIYHLTVLEVRTPTSASLGSKQGIIRAVCLLEDPGDSLPFSLSFPASKGACIPGPSSILTARRMASPSLSLTAFALPSSIFLENLCNSIGSNQMIQENLSFSKSLT